MIELLNDDSGKLVLYNDFDLNRSIDLESWLDVSVFSQERIVLFGKQFLQPRLIRFEGDAGVEYTYSNKTYSAEPWSQSSEEIRERLKLYTKTAFNSVLINLYRDGNDSMGLHADNETSLGENPTIASVSYGVSRIIKFKKNDGSKRVEVELKHGSLLVMSGAIQSNWKHEISKTKKVFDPRVNYTFRRIIRK